MDTGLDPASLDAWTDIGSQLCPHVLSVVVDQGTTLAVRCEVEGEHDEHEATLRWNADPPT
jgi:hypothetical protein